MLDPTAEGEFWCPISDRPPPPDMTASDAEALTRIDCGDWVSDAQIERLEMLGLIEKAFGQALLTRLGRAALGHPPAAV